MPVSSPSGEMLIRAGLARRATARAIDALCMLGLYALTLAVVSLVLALGLAALALLGADILGGGSGEGLLFLLLLLWVPSAWMAVHRYEAVSTAGRGQTFGKRLMGICVVRYLDPSGIVVELPEPGSSRLRWAIPHAAVSAAAVLLVVALSAADQAELTDREVVVLLLGLWAFVAVAWAACYVSALFDSQRRGWHDKAAGTIVICATDEVLERLATPGPVPREPVPKDRPLTRDDPPRHSSYVQYWDQYWDDHPARKNRPPPRSKAD